LVLAATGGTASTIFIIVLVPVVACCFIRKKKKEKENKKSQEKEKSVTSIEMAPTQGEINKPSPTVEIYHHASPEPIEDNKSDYHTTRQTNYNVVETQQDIPTSSLIF
jgi:hypothetical protein